MNNKKVEIQFWESKNGFKPVKDFFDKLPKIYFPKIKKKIGFIPNFNFDELLQYGDILTLVAGFSKIKPRPYELKIKISSPIRILCYRKANILVLVEAIEGSFSNKNKLKKAIEVYKKRVC